LNEEVYETIDLAVATDVEVDLDLHIESAYFDGGAAPCDVVLPDTGRTTFHVFADDLTVYVPDGVVGDFRSPDY
jgi:Na+-transporting NADH:ubiquinone oxidoreductase subunit NqrF